MTVFNFNLCDCSKTQILFNTYGRWGTCTDPNCVNLCLKKEEKLRQREKQIQNQVGVESSQMMDVKSAFTIGEDLMKKPRTYSKFENVLPNYPFRNLSDRSVGSNSAIKFHNNVPTRGSSTVSSVTSNKPGSSAPGGIGVDVKHGSYARYLGKLKASNIQSDETTQPYTPPTIKAGRLRPAVNNKSYRFSIINTKNCKCLS
jgi:hypothetical protein